MWVDQVPGAGKSTMARQIVDYINTRHRQEHGELAEDVAVIYPMDGYHIRREELRSLENGELLLKRRGAPFTFDPQRMLQDICSIKRDNCGFVPDFDHGQVTSCC